MPSERWASSIVGVAICEILVNYMWVFGFMGVGQLGLGCCQAFYYLGQGMWGILWLFHVCVSCVSWLLKRGHFWVSLRLRAIVCVWLFVPMLDIIRGVNIPSCNFPHLYEGVKFICLVLLWLYLGIYHGSRWILQLLWSLMGLGGWVYGYLGGGAIWF